MNESFKVAPSALWPLVVMIVGLGGVFYAWKQYIPQRFGRENQQLMRMGAVFVYAAAMVFYVGQSTRSVLVNGNTLFVRPSFSLSYRAYPVRDATNMRETTRRSRKRRSSRTVLTITFRDGSTTEVERGDSNYQRFKSYLDSHGVIPVER